MSAMMSFSDIYTLYYKRSLMFVKSYVRYDQVAEDITSESLIQLWETMKVETVERPLALLITILRNRSLNYLKRQEIKLEVMENISSVQIRDINYRIMSLEACAPSAIYTDDINHIINKTLNSLPEQTQRIFRMSRYEQMPVKEIAEKMGVSSKTVEYHITKALKELRISLKDYLPMALFFFKEII
ncbi:MAG: RNA polymerase sigma-70 factor [Parabacteroides sp.]|nr:RNA polymerase sigma-70 factor [Parabacteroides sp.]